MAKPSPLTFGNTLTKLVHSLIRWGPKPLGEDLLDPKPYPLFNNTLEQQMLLKSVHPDWALYYALWDESSDTEDR